MNTPFPSPPRVPTFMSPAPFRRKSKAKARSRFASFLLAAVIAWLGWCLVLVAEAARDAVAAKGCAEAGGMWQGRACVLPEIHLQLGPKASVEDERDPLLGPGGA